MDICQRDPLQKRSSATSPERTQDQATFYYGEFPVVERHYRIRLQERIRSFRAVLLELKLYADEWPGVVNLV
jgi:hypothetical protein